MFEITDQIDTIDGLKFTQFCFLSNRFVAFCIIYLVSFFT